MENAGGMDEASFLKALEDLCEARESTPDSGQFAGTGQWLSKTELEAGREALVWLCKGKSPHILEEQQPNPPDVLFVLENGERISFEVTRVSHEKTMQSIAHQKKQGGTNHLYQDWTPNLFREAIEMSLRKKEERFSKHLLSGTVHKPIHLILGADSMMADTRLVDGYHLSSEVFESVLIHFGYRPGENGNGGPLIVDLTERS